MSSQLETAAGNYGVIELRGVSKRPKTKQKKKGHAVVVGTTWINYKGRKKCSLVIEQEQGGESIIKGSFVLCHREWDVRTAELMG